MKNCVIYMLTTIPSEKDATSFLYAFLSSSPLKTHFGAVMCKLYTPSFGSSCRNREREDFTRSFFVPYPSLKSCLQCYGRTCSIDTFDWVYCKRRIAQCIPYYGKWLTLSELPNSCANHDAHIFTGKWL